MTLSLEIATLDGMAGLDFKSSFDELSELRELLTIQQIAEFTGLRRETISRARPGRPFRPRTEKAIGDLYLVVTRLRSVAGLDLGHVAAILRRPQVALGDRSIGELLKAGEVELVLRHLADPPPASSAPTPSPRPTPARPEDRSQEDAVEAFLAADPELAALLPEIEAKVREHFGPRVRIERGMDIEPGSEEIGIYLRAHNGLPFEENVERLKALSIQEEDLLDPVADRLGIGFL
jgi:hypothetical protein